MSGASMVGFMDLKNVLTETLMSQENIYTYETQLKLHSLRPTSPHPKKAAYY